MEINYPFSRPGDLRSRARELVRPPSGRYGSPPGSWKAILGVLESRARALHDPVIDPELLFTNFLEFCSPDCPNAVQCLQTIQNR